MDLASCIGERSGASADSRQMAAEHYDDTVISGVDEPSSVKGCPEPEPVVPSRVNRDKEKSGVAGVAIPEAGSAQEGSTKIGMVLIGTDSSVQQAPSASAEVQTSSEVQEAPSASLEVQKKSQVQEAHSARAEVHKSSEVHKAPSASAKSPEVQKASNAEDQSAGHSSNQSTDPSAGPNTDPSADHSRLPGETNPKQQRNGTVDAGQQGPQGQIGPVG